MNKRRSKALHLISQRQTFGNRMSGIEASEVKAELAKPDGHVELNNGEFGKDFGIIPTSDMAAGNFQMLEEAKAAFNVVGANTSVTGKEDRVMSGRAEIVRQQAGIRELAPVTDAHAHFKKRIYRQVWNRIRQYWTANKWIRVTDDERNMKWVELNKPVTVGQVMEQEFANDPQKMAIFKQQYANDPRLNQVAEVQNQLSELDVDILIEEAPDVATIQEEQFDLIAKMYQANPNAIPFESIIEVSSLRNKDKMLEKIRGTEEQQAQRMEQQKRADALIEQEKSIEMANKQADTQAKKAKAIRDVSEAKAKQLENQAVEKGIAYAS